MTSAPELDAEFVMQTYGRAPVTFIRGEGSRLWDSQGREYLDFLGGLAVTSLGHSHPVVAEAVAVQARTLMHVSNLFYNDLQPRLAQRLNSLIGGGGKCFFANSGAEANECAIKLVRREGQGRGTPKERPDHFVVVSLDGSFHGRTLGTLSATGQPAKQETFQPLPDGFKQVAANDISALSGAILPDVCAVMLEVVQAEGGVRPLDFEYLRAVRNLCDERSVRLVIDEVQTGLGRTGSWFAFQQAGIRPDVVTMAKALGNGMPIGACWASEEVARGFEPGDHATTFGGQPLAVSAALAVLDVMEREDVPALSRRLGNYLTEGLSKLPGVIEVRGLGLLLAAELAMDIDARAVVNSCLDTGLIVNAVTPHAIRFSPSLLVAVGEIDSALGILKSVLEDMAQSQGVNRA